MIYKIMLDRIWLVSLKIKKHKKKKNKYKKIE